MQVEQTDISGVVILKPKRFEDERGYFCETYNQNRFFEKTNVKIDFVQDNESLSLPKGTLRGLHFQHKPFEQSKLVRVLKGSIYDVVVDLRENSPTYKQWIGIELNSQNGLQLFVPKGCAHGFCTLEENTCVAYKVDQFYSKEHDGGVRFNDSELAIMWPTQTPLLSEKDRSLPFLSELNKKPI